MDREAAIQQFVERNDFTERLVAVAQQIASQNPHAVAIIWETDSGYSMTTLPFSEALAYGLVHRAMKIVQAEDASEDADDSD